MRVTGQIWIERNLFLVASSFFFLVDAEKNLGISLVMMILLIINKNSAISEKILHLSFLSLSLLII